MTLVMAMRAFAQKISQPDEQVVFILPDSELALNRSIPSQLQMVYPAYPSPLSGYTEMTVTNDDKTEVATRSIESASEINKRFQLYDGLGVKCVLLLHKEGLIHPELAAYTHAFPKYKVSLSGQSPNKLVRLIPL